MAAGEKHPSTTMRGKVFAGASGYYIATIRADGSHRQPAPESGLWYPTREAACAALRESTARDAEMAELAWLKRMAALAVAALGGAVDAMVRDRIHRLAVESMRSGHRADPQLLAREAAGLWGDV